MENQQKNTADKNGSQPFNAHILHKYGIIQSLQDMMTTAQGNPVTFIVTLIISYVLSGIVAVLTSLAMVALVFGKFGLLFASLGKILTVLIVGLIVYTLLYAVVYAFTISCIAFSLSDEKYSVATTIRKAFSATPRIVKVNVLVAIYAYWPIAIAAFLPLFLLSSTRGGSPLAALTPLLVIVALIWAIIANLRYALAPYIVMFDPDIATKEALRRSQELLKHGGQWFIVKGFLLLLGIIIFLSKVTGMNLQQLENSNDLSVNSILIVLSILVEGALVMLYFNRSQKQTLAANSKSPKLLILVFLILAGLTGIAAVQSRSNPTNGHFSDAGQEQIAKLRNNTEEIKTRTIAGALELYYNDNGYYPSSANIADIEWVRQNESFKYLNLSEPIRYSSLSDSRGNFINSPSSDFQYRASPDNCTQCASFELTARLPDGELFKQESLYHTVKATANPTPAPSSPVTTSPPTTPTAKNETFNVLYRIAADGNSAQLTPVTATFGAGTTSVDIIIDLQCLGTCKFKLTSDTYSFSNTTTYTTSQKIKYQLTKHGKYILYNQFIPGTKFKIEF